MTLPKFQPVIVLAVADIGAKAVVQSTAVAIDSIRVLFKIIPPYFYVFSSPLRRTTFRLHRP